MCAVVRAIIKTPKQLSLDLAGEVRVEARILPSDLATVLLQRHLDCLQF